MQRQEVYTDFYEPWRIVKIIDATFSGPVFYAELSHVTHVRWKQSLKTLENNQLITKVAPIAVKPQKGKNKPK